MNVLPQILDDDSDADGNGAGGAIWYTKSVDGAFWTDKIKLADIYTYTGTVSPEMDTANEDVYIVWVDKNEGTAKTYFKQTVSPAALNPSVDVGNDGIIEWSHAGELENSVVIHPIESVRAYLEGKTDSEDEELDETISIPINFHCDYGALEVYVKVDIGGYAFSTDPLNPYHDGDGLTDGEEVLDWHTNPTKVDTDDDGLDDDDELYYWHDTVGLTDAEILNTNPDADKYFNLLLDQDSDGDGLVDGEEEDFWEGVGPGLSYTDSDGDGWVNILDGDSDNDTLKDGWELDYWGARLYADFDGDDSLINILDNDADGEGLLDGIELAGWDTYIIGVKWYTAYADPALEDTDNDGLDDEEEYRERTNPEEADTDGDGAFDALEVMGWKVFVYSERTGELKAGYESGVTVYSDPLNQDTDYDGLLDGEEYGISDPNNRDTDGDHISDAADSNIIGIEARSPSIDWRHWATDWDILHPISATLHVSVTGSDSETPLKEIKIKFNGKEYPKTFTPPYDTNEYTFTKTFTIWFCYSYDIEVIVTDVNGNTVINKSHIPSVFEKAIKTFENLIGQAVDVLGTSVDVIKGWVTEQIEQIWKPAKEIIDVAVEIIKNGIASELESIKNRAMSKAFNSLEGGSGPKDAVKDAVTPEVSVLQNFFNPLTNAVSKMYNMISPYLSAVSELLDKANNYLAEKMIEVINEIAPLEPNMETLLRDAFKGEVDPEIESSIESAGLDFSDTESFIDRVVS